MNRIAILCFLLIFSFSCTNNQSKTARSGNTDDNLSAAMHLVIEEFANYTRVIIKCPWQDNDNDITFVYYLAGKDSILPDTIAEESVIRVPVQRIICMSTTHVAMLKALGAEQTITGISGTKLIYDESIRKLIESGDIMETGYDNNIDKELVVSLDPDILIAYAVNSSSAEYYHKLEEMGVKILFNADYLENNPLARCEWIKLFGVLTGKKEKADSIFYSVSEKYNDLKNRISLSIEKRPSVLLGAPWEDVWYIPPENSYVVRLIKDAGGRYLFSDQTQSFSVPYSIEAVFDRGFGADVWLNPGTADDIGDISEMDYRLTTLNAVRSGRVYNNNKRTGREGGNDYWESGVMHPDILLKDMAYALHPDIFTGYDPLYYKQLK